MLSEVKKYQLDECHGWAFDPCEDLAQWIMIEIWHNGSWAATGLCKRHARECMAGTPQEHSPPRYRQWWLVADFIESGEWPREP